MMAHLYCFEVFFTSLYLFFGLDDLFIDVVAWVRRLGPKGLSKQDIKALNELTQKNIAVMIPAWQEEEVIQRMINGNLSQIDFINFHFFVGVYPNDPRTITKVESTCHRNRNVHLILNFKEGPTSKGQMLNEIVRQVILFEDINEISFDAFLIHDAEDVIHEKSLKLINSKLHAGYDFIQLPVLPLNSSHKELVGGTYVDEFSECHMKELLVREYLRAGLPSAGVGTAFSKKLVASFLKEHGKLFTENTLTEDYDLGIRAFVKGFKATFACYQYGAEKSLIATREFFPKSIRKSFLQKKRWNLGIVIQGWKNLKWIGCFSNKYFLYRDRRGIVTHWLNVVAWFYCLLAINLKLEIEQLQVLTFATCILMLHRIVMRTFYVSRIYGLKSMWLVVFRYPLANAINAASCFFALMQGLKVALTKTSVQWVKTEHELPAFFGRGTVQIAEGAV